MLAQDRRPAAVENAVALTRLGYYMAPVTLRRGLDGKKRPHYHGQWGKISTLDPDQIVAWAAEHGPDLSFCVDTERSGVVGIDLDVKAASVDRNGVHHPAIDACLMWAEQGLPIPTMIVHTPSGGQHHYWRAPAGTTFTNRQAVWPGVDVRAAGGHLYAPGARIVGEPGHYEADQLVAVADLLELHPDVAAKLERDRPRASLDRRSQTAVSAWGARHDRDWVVAQCMGQLERVRNHSGHGAEFRYTLLGASVMFGRAVAAGLRSRDQAERMLGDAVHGVFGSVNEDDALWIEQGLEFGESDPWTITETIEASVMPRSDDAAAPSASSPPVVEVPAAPEVPAAATGWALSTPGGERHVHGGGPVQQPPGRVQELATTDRSQTVSASVEVPLDQAGLWPTDVGYDPVAAKERHIATKVAEELERRQVRRMADAAERPYREPMRSGLVDVSELESVAPPTMLVSGIVPDAAVGYLGGRSGSYKTFLAVTIGCALARGTAPMGFPDWVPSRRVNVLYVAAEGPSGVAARVRAEQVVNGQLEPGSFTLYRRAVDLTDDQVVAELTGIVVEKDIGFVIVDTFGRSSGDSEDNSTTDTRRVFSAVAQLRDDHGVGGMFLDHTGHAGERLRGASGKGDDADYVILSTYDGEDRGPHVQRKVLVRKLKDEASTAWWNVRLRQIELSGIAKPVGVAEAGEVTGEASGPFGVVELRWWEDIERPLPDAVLELVGPGAKVAREMFRVLRFAGTDMTMSKVQRAVNERPGGETYSEATFMRGRRLLAEAQIPVIESPIGKSASWQLTPEYLDN